MSIVASVQASAWDLLSHLSTLPNSADVGVREVAAMLDCCTEHVSRLAKAGKFVKPHRLGRIRRWNLGLVRKFLYEQAEKANAS
jgi:hypothetical protein